MSPEITKITRHLIDGEMKEARDTVIDIPDDQDNRVAKTYRGGEIGIELLRNGSGRIKGVVVNLEDAINPGLLRHGRRVDVSKKLGVGRSQLSKNQWLEVKVNRTGGASRRI